MTVSALAEGRVWPLGKTPSGANRFYKRPGKPQGFIVHHAAGTSDAVLKAQYVSKSRELSSNYAMTQAGDIVAILHEEYRPFTSAAAKADNWGITIEIVNELGAPSWKISDRAFDQLARLIADCATRWGFPINRSTVIGHREVRAKFGQGIATACPGPWLWARMDELVALARKYQQDGKTKTSEQVTEPAAPPIQEQTMYRLRDASTGAVYLVTDRGSVHIKTPAHDALFDRMLGVKIDGTPVSQPARSMNSLELATVTGYIAAAGAGSQAAVEKAVRDAVAGIDLGEGLADQVVDAIKQRL